MTKIVQIVGGSRESMDAYLGAQREITVDLSNMDLRVHNGVTLGGFPILNRDNADVRYQARDVELDGLTGFEPQERGILVRLGPASYTLRNVSVVPGQLTVVDGNGYNGNPVVGLASTITSGHRFEGSTTFALEIVAEQGLLGDTTGTHYGDSHGDHFGNVLGNVQGNANGNHTGTFKGDVDVSTNSILFANNQIPISAIDGLLDYIKSVAFESGDIKQFYGDVTVGKPGWALCDGTNGTPDLRDRMVLGVSALNPMGTVGGSLGHVHTGTALQAGGHNHGVTATPTILGVQHLPQHRHGSGIGGSTGDVAVPLYGSGPATGTRSMTSDGDPVILEPFTSYTGGGEGHSHGATVTIEGLHTHSVTVDSTDNRPPFVALAYYMKL